MSESLALFLSPEELAARNLIRDQFGVDAARTFQFWEAAVARIIAGRVTGHQCPWDVEIDYGPEIVRVEVKFSQEFPCRFPAGVRQVYKFADPKGGGLVKAADVIVFVGIDATDNVDLWVAPADEIGQAKSITLTVPRTRVSGSYRSQLAGWDYPFDQLLPAVLHARHLHYDRGHHAETRSVTRSLSRAAAGELPLPFAGVNP